MYILYLMYWINNFYKETNRMKKVLGLSSSEHNISERSFWYFVDDLKEDEIKVLRHPRKSTYIIYSTKLLTIILEDSIQDTIWWNSQSAKPLYTSEHISIHTFLIFCHGTLVIKYSKYMFVSSQCQTRKNVCFETTEISSKNW